MRRTPLTGGLAALVAALALAGCGGGGDDGPEEVEADLSEELQSSLDIGEDEADCFANVLVDEIGTEDLQDIDFTAEEPPEGMQERFAAAALTAVDECEIDASAFGG